MDIHPFTNHDIARARGVERVQRAPETLGGASRRPEAVRRAPFGLFAASAGAGPSLRPSRARSESARPAAMPASSVCHRVTRSFFVPMTNTSFAEARG